MKKTKILLLIISTILIAAGLYLINKDLYHFEYSYPFSRFFTPEEDSKGNFILTEPVPLKKAVYQLTFSASVDAVGSGCYLIDSKDNVFFSADIGAGHNDFVHTITSKDNQ